MSGPKTKVDGSNRLTALKMHWCELGDPLALTFGNFWDRPLPPFGPSTFPRHMSSSNEQLRTKLSCHSPPKFENQLIENSNEASILWILDSAIRLTNYILVFSHWDFLISFTKVLKLRKLSKFRISSIPRIINLWFEIPSLDQTIMVTLWKRILEVPRL